ncbi:MAG: sterol desaturase/sphingolipid hydroxylase (fatty acid hydroxylase superfamily) [Myxococcota bacterium]|jgi:sterol desaturase/sphingolipid hydroxylase (fatty acid hydroxylase superfamily)
MAELQTADFVAHMNHRKVYRNTIARMFDHPLLEVASHVHPAVPLLVFAPIVAWFTYQSALVASAPVVLAGLALGGLAWTLAEYTLHRFLFHFPDGNAVGRFVYFYTHGIHHDYPDDPTRLVMTPVLSVPLAVLFYVGFGLVFPAHWVSAAFAGFVLGYLAYDYAHYATHHLRAPSHPALGWLAAIMKEQRRRHMVHHFKRSDGGYGVSTSLWDRVFGTTV